MMLHTLNRTWQLRSLKSHAGFGHVPYKFRHGTFGQCKRRIRPFESTTTHAEGQQQSTAAELSPARRLELVKACKTVLAELSGLDFSKSEVQKYVVLARKGPKNYADFDMGRTSATLSQVIKAQDLDDIKDVEALEVLNLMLCELWRWSRRGTGGGWADEEVGPMHQQALAALQGLGPEQLEADGEKLTSVLLDQLELSDRDKAEIGRAVEQVAIAGIGSFVWGGIVFAALFLIGFNFLRPKSSPSYSRSELHITKQVSDLFTLI
eukprot:jgi/Chrzof1/9086/Cz03g35170.t1